MSKLPLKPNEHCYYAPQSFELDAYAVVLGYGQMDGQSLEWSQLPTSQRSLSITNPDSATLCNIFGAGRILNQPGDALKLPLADLGAITSLRMSVAKLGGSHKTQLKIGEAGFDYSSPDWIHETGVPECADYLEKHPGEPLIVVTSRESLDYARKAIELKLQSAKKAIRNARRKEETDDSEEWLSVEPEDEKRIGEMLDFIEQQKREKGEVRYA